MFMLINSLLFSAEPVSKQGTIVETVSSAEVMVEATGIYNGQGKNDKAKGKDVDANGVTQGLIDARRAALYTVLFGGSDPVLKDASEKQKFGAFAEEFYNENNLFKYITYEDAQLLKKVKINNSIGLKVVKRFKINKETLINDLVAKEILIAQKDITQALGNPMIMVLPAVEKGVNPIEMLQTNEAVKHAANVIQSYLTARAYDVVVPEQQAVLQDLSAAQNMVEGRESDYAYDLALSIGSDVYITYSGTLEDAGYGTQRYSMGVSAFETTTGRLLGTETGYSQGRRGETMVSIEEAMNDAIDKVLSRVNEYWKSDLTRGIQYKLLISVSTDFDEDQVEDIQFAMMDALEGIAKSVKENVLTKQTMDYLLWCSPDEYDKSSNVYRAIRKSFTDAGTEGTLRRININRKMIILKIDFE